ncbi:uncharacterized protein LOC108627745 [Ceratina calcarata]|uniref:Uncharacterized protein LOC108627745 n=1 Tax=Ceratina calcarata TaxID=156304 RepID=A0AAJ7S8W5_9HYME|nr:uncharacterized protein LOC108627745 [Ceratina calcarata]
MIRICFLIVVAASVATAEDEVKPEYCIDYHPQCPVDETANSTATHLPVYQDCHKFYKCDYGRACVFSCPTYNGGTRQLVFNPKLQVCDYPWNVPGLPNCEGIYLLIVAVNAVTANTEVKPDYCIDYHPQCPVDETANSTATHLPVYENCHKFYKCDFGRACVFSCPMYNGGTRQLVFNPKLQVCDYPWNVPGLPNCSDTPSTNSTTTVTPPTDTPPDTPTTTPTSTTPGGGIYLLIVAVNAVTANAVVKPEYCIDYHPQCPVDETANSTATHLPVYQNCHKFYKCDFGRACLFSCPMYNGGTRQLVFNPKLQVCDYPWNVPGLPNCEGDSNTPTISTPTVTPPTISTPSGTPPTITTTTPGGSIPGACLDKCPESGHARVRHQLFCNYYYECADGKYVLVKCLENFYFNCYVQACDRPQNLPPNYPCSGLGQ